MENTADSQILVVDDSEPDFILISEAFKDAKIVPRLNWVKNGEECMAYLRKEIPFAEAIQPDLIFLDMNMPKVGGLEILAEMIKDERLKHIPVIVFSSSQDEEDVRQAYLLRCQGYILKPMQFEDFRKILDSLTSYWFSACLLPKPPNGGKPNY